MATKYPPLAMQLITLTDELAKDPQGTLNAIADMGCKGVELHPTFKWEDAPVLAEQLRRAGLVCAGYWVGWSDLKNLGHPAYEAARILRPHYWATCIWCGNLARDWRACIEKVRWGATVASQAGQLMVYHGHAWDAGPVDAEAPDALELLFDELPPAIMQCMYDTYYVRRSGVADPVAHMRRRLGRLPVIHCKEMVDPNGAQSHAAMGDGCIDWKGVFNLAAESGTAWMALDHNADHCKGLDIARRSVNHLKGLGLVSC